MVTITIWPLGQLRGAIDALKKIRPQRIMLHSDPASLLSAGPAAVATLRKELAFPFEVWAGAAFDVGQTGSATLTGAALSSHLSSLAVTRRKAGTAAIAMGATRLMLDPESAWKLRAGKPLPGFSAQDARAESMSLRTELREHGIALEATSFDCPSYHATFPWGAWAIDRWWGQIYAYPEHGPAVAGMGAARLALHEKCWTAASGVDLTIPQSAYVAAYKVTTPDTTFICDAFDEAAFWAIPTRLDPDGLRAAWALARIAELIVCGKGRVAAFQRAHGLKADSKVGPATLSAIEGACGEPCPWPF